MPIRCNGRESCQCYDCYPTLEGLLVMERRAGELRMTWPTLKDLPGSVESGRKIIARCDKIQSWIDDGLDRALVIRLAQEIYGYSDIR
jgi:macrodomain Ter protein organizer (MatP/YcbG family)